MDCVFCEIVAGRLPASFVWEDEEVLAFLSLEQPNPYKVLVIPRTHVETLYDLNDQQAAHILQAAVRIARAIRDVSGCEGLNLAQSNGRAGQQDVFHFHLHLLPRFSDDVTAGRVLLHWDNTVQERPVLDMLAAKVRARLQP
ncbi:MAG: HIT domain-containing protein [Chloroflexota bacterium]|nr:HIT domain-containing protein [Chloroflexota bacterium]